MEFGSRRAQGYDGAIYGARAAYIGGCIGTACTIAEKELSQEILAKNEGKFQIYITIYLNSENLNKSIDFKILESYNRNIESTKVKNI